MVEAFLVEGHGERERDSSEKKGEGWQRERERERERSPFPRLSLKYLASKITNLPIELLPNYN